MTTTPFAPPGHRRARAGLGGRSGRHGGRDRPRLRVRRRDRRPDVGSGAQRCASTFGPPVLTGDQVLVPANSGTLYAVDRASGHLVSRIETGETLLHAGSPTAATSSLIAGFEDPPALAFGEIRRR